MALPSSIETERNRYLMDLVRNASEPVIDWPAPNRDDVVLIGKIVMLYSYIDFNLRRMIELLDHAKIALVLHVPASQWVGRETPSRRPTRGKSFTAAKFQFRDAPQANFPVSLKF